MLPLLSRHRTSHLPSPLKSPVPTIDQVVGTFPTPAALGFKMVVPFISQMATLPLVSRQRMSQLPSPLKSPVPTMDQVVGTFPTPAVLGFKTVVPFISQIATLPSLVSRQAMSLLWSPLKSWGLGVSAKRPILLAPLSVNQSAPSGPVVMYWEEPPAVGTGNSETHPAVVMRSIWLASSRVNQSAPSGPVVILLKASPDVGVGNSVIAPAVVMRPTLPVPSTNHSAPSGPVVMPEWKLFGVGIENAVIKQVVVSLPMRLRHHVETVTPTSAPVVLLST